MSGPDPVMGAMMEAAVTGIEGFKSSVGYGELEAIVRDLATSEEPMTDHPTGLMLRCKVCGGVTQETGVLRHHLDTCAWRRAVEFVSAHPVSGDQQ